MESPLLKGKPDKEKEEEEEEEEGNVPKKGGCWEWFSFPWTRRSEPSNAETVVMLKQVMVDLGLAISQADANSARKKREAIKLRDRGKLAEMKAAWSTAKMYDRRHAELYGMREVVEQIKAEIIAQQNNLSVFGAFSRANRTLEKMFEHLKLGELEKVLGSLHEHLQEGREISETLASPGLIEEIPEDELREEMAAFVSGEKDKVPLLLPLPREEEGEVAEKKNSPPPDKIRRPMKI